MAQSVGSKPVPPGESSERGRLLEAQALAHVGSWDLDLLNDALTWSDEIFRIFEIDPAEFSASYEGFLHAVHPDDRELVDAAYQRSLRERTSYSVIHRLLMPDGRIKWVQERGQSHYALDGVPVRSVGTVQDITELRIAELQRQRAEARFVELFDSALDALVIVDRLGRVVQANRAAEETFGYTLSELLSLTVEDLVPEQARAGHVHMRQQFLSHARQRRMGATRSRLTARRKDGTTIPVEISLNPLNEEETNLVVATVRDVSERLRVEEQRTRLADQLRQSQKLESLGTLAGGIAHDFNNLLAVISINVELASRRIGPISEQLSEIGVATTRAAELVKQILTFSRQQPTKRVSTSLSSVVGEAARMLRATLPAAIRLETHCDSNLPPALVDPTQLHQVLTNLATNAWHAIEGPTGTIAIRASSVSAADSPPAPGMDPGQYVCIQVSDNGSGMDPAIVARIFEPFYTTKPVGKGTGLGLAVVHGIVAEHGGHIDVCSAPGEGTTMSIYLPVVEETGSAKNSDSVYPTLGSGRVLLLDDEPSLLRAGSRLLRSLGYQVKTFLEASDALECLRQDPENFDVVITDQDMPELSGLDVAREVRKLRRDLPVVLVSGYLLYTDDELRAANIHSVLVKPYRAAELHDAILNATDPTG